LEADFVRAIGEEVTPEAGGLVPADTLHLILAGNVTADGRSLGPKDCFGAAALLGQGAEVPAVAGPGVHLLRLTPAALDALSDRHPRLGLRLYRNLAACAKRDDAPGPMPAPGSGDAAIG
jgi:CRP-like cAMP-binding protein